MVRRKSIIRGASRKRGKKVRTPPSRTNITREVDNASESSDTDKSNRSEDKVPRTKVKVMRRSQVVGSQNKRKQKAALAAKKGLTRRPRTLTTYRSLQMFPAVCLKSQIRTILVRSRRDLLRFCVSQHMRLIQSQRTWILCFSNMRTRTKIQTCYPMLLGHILMSLQVGSQNKMRFSHLYLLNRFRFQSLHRYHLRLRARFGLTSMLIFAALLPNYSTQPKQQKFTLQLGNDSTFNLVPQSQTRKITHIAQWTSAFIRFVAVYSEKFPQESAQPMIYGEVIRDLAYRRPGLSWYHYDMQFRQLRETVTYRWDMIHYDLWVPSATFYPFQGFNSQGQQSNTNNPFLKNCCWAFNRSGRCAEQDCNFPHSCGFCRGPHYAKQCTQQQSKTGPDVQGHQRVLESPSTTMGAPVYRGDKFRLVTLIQ